MSTPGTKRGTFRGSRSRYNVSPAMRRWTRAVMLMLVPIVLTCCGGRGRARSGDDEADDELLSLNAHSTGDGRTALRIENVSDGPLVLSRGVAIEALELFGESQQNQELEEYGIESSHFFLISSCDQPTSGCVTLEPGASLQTIPWSGYYSEPQCPSDTPSDYAAPSGRYRFVVTACSGGRQFFSAPFEHGAAELK